MTFLFPVPLVIGLFELAFFAVAWSAHPGPAALARDATDLPIGNRDFLFLVAAVIGATNPWMIFYSSPRRSTKGRVPAISSTPDKTLASGRF